MALPRAPGAAGLSLKGVDTKSATYKRALAACRPVIAAALKAISPARSKPVSPLHPASPPAAPPSRPSAPTLPVHVPPAVTAVMKRFTACMRKEGVTAFPEPTGASFELSGTGVDATSPRYKTAQTRCNPILSGMFKAGG